MLSTKSQSGSEGPFSNENIEKSKTQQCLHDRFRCGTNCAYFSETDHTLDVDEASIVIALFNFGLLINSFVT